MSSSYLDYKRRDGRAALPPALTNSIAYNPTQPAYHYNLNNPSDDREPDIRINTSINEGQSPFQK